MIAIRDDIVSPMASAREGIVKRLVICMDGTWNDADRASSDGEGRTNVARLHDLVRTSGTRMPQVKLYHKGVGNGGWWEKALGGATGWGLSHNVQQCYDWLSEHYEPGDEIWLFGFSRGAFTARSLAGLIRNASVLRPEHRAHVGNAYDLYRSRAKEKHPKAEDSILFRQAYGYGEQRIAITCVGVWDTVGSLGVPTSGPLGWYTRKRYGFHDVTLSSWVQNAFHALAIDERRKPFAPTLWEVRDEDVRDGTRKQRVEQAWFAGVHSNVGGGYTDTRLSDIALDWMLRRAGSCGLELDPWNEELDCCGTLYDSMSWYYKALGVFPRPIGAAHLHEDGTPMHTFEYVHRTAFERQRTFKPPYREGESWKPGVYGVERLPSAPEIMANDLL
jgi:uncharacterized protein (DUF2235 family)